MDQADFDAEHYVKEAQRCADLGAAAPDARTARRWRALADQYVILAEAIFARRTRAAARWSKMRRQQVQVPQGKLK